MKLTKTLLLISGILLIFNCGEDGAPNQTSLESEDGTSRIIARYKVESDGYFYYNPPTLVNGYIYIGTSSKLETDALATDNCFIKLDINTNLCWKYRLGKNEVRGAAVVDSKGNVYFVVVEGRGTWEDAYKQAETYLYKLDSEGQFKWKVNLATAGQIYHMGMVNPAVDENDIIYVGGDKLYAIDPEDGKFKWEYPEGEAKMVFTNAPIIDSDRNVYFIANNKTEGENEVYSLKDGTLNWKCRLEKGFTLSSPAFNVEGNELIAASGQTIYWIDLKNGNIKRKYTPEGITGELRGSPAVDGDNNVFVGEKSNTNSIFFAIKADGTGLLWSKKIGADLYSSPALGDDGLIYTASEDTRDGDKGKGNRFHAINKTTGETVWALKLEMDVTWGSAVIDENGYIYIGDMKGYFYKIKSDCSGLDPHAAWPRFRGSNEGTGRKMGK